MGNKLYKVKVSTELVVFAEDESLVRQIALRNAGEEVSQLGTTEITEVEAQTDIPSSWQDVVPYPSDTLINNPQTCKQLSRAMPMRRPKEDKPEPIVEQPKPQPIPDNIPEPPKNDGPIPGRLPVLRWDAL